MKESRRNMIPIVSMLSVIAALCTQAIYAEEPGQNQSSDTQSIAEHQTGELLYSDDFSSSKSSWPIYTQGNLLTGYKNGKYHITIVPPNHWDGVNAPRVNLSDFIMEVEASKEAGPDDNVYGVFVRNIRGGSFYTFMISSDGYYDYVKKDNNTWATTSNWTKSSAIKAGNETNLIRLISKGDKFIFYVNGEKLGEYTDNSFSYGGLGLWVGSQTEGNVTLSFDNLNVWAIDEE